MKKDHPKKWSMPSDHEIQRELSNSQLGDWWFFNAKHGMVFRVTKEEFNNWNNDSLVDNYKIIEDMGDLSETKVKYYIEQLIKNKEALEEASRLLKLNEYL